jgi:hypothetical protein
MKLGTFCSVIRTVLLLNNVLKCIILILHYIFFVVSSLHGLKNNLITN